MSEQATPLPPKLKNLCDSAIILIDSKEQMPLEIEMFKTIRRGLPIGDYGIHGFSDWDNPRFICERKSLSDLVGSLTSGRARFFRELHKMRQFGFRCLLIEATIDEVANGTYRSNASAKSLLASLDSMSVRMGLHIFWCRDHLGAARQFESLVRQFIRGIENDSNVIRKVARNLEDVV